MIHTHILHIQHQHQGDHARAKRIHSVLTCVSLSISHELHGSVSATTKRRLVFSIRLAWNSLRRDKDGYSAGCIHHVQQGAERQ